jgi:hypothetical protein
MSLTRTRTPFGSVTRSYRTATTLAGRRYSAALHAP